MRRHEEGGSGGSKLSTTSKTWKRRSSTMLALAAACAVLLVSCGQKEGAAKWYSNLRSDYQMVVKRDCFCEAGTSRVRVRDAVVTRATLNGRPLPLPTTMPLSVDDLFLVIYRAESQGWDMDVTYDETWGYPTHIVIEEGGSDGHLEIQVEDFETFPPGQTPNGND